MLFLVVLNSVVIVAASQLIFALRSWKPCEIWNLCEVSFLVALSGSGRKMYDGRSGLRCSILTLLLEVLSCLIILVGVS